MTHTHYQVGWAEWMQAGPNQPLFKSQKYATTQIKPGAREKRKIKVLGLMELKVKVGNNFFIAFAISFAVRRTPTLR